MVVCDIPTNHSFREFRGYYSVFNTRFIRGPRLQLQ
jgi:hypothetical protein